LGQPHVSPRRAFSRRCNRSATRDPGSRLHDVLMGLAVLLAAALGLAIWAFSQSRQPAALRDVQLE